MKLYRDQGGVILSWIGCQEVAKSRDILTG